MQFRSRHLENETGEGGELMNSPRFDRFFRDATSHAPVNKHRPQTGGELHRPFGPGQVALQFDHVVGALDMPRAMRASNSGRVTPEISDALPRDRIPRAYRTTATSFDNSACAAAGVRWISSKIQSGTSNVSVTLK